MGGFAVDVSPMHDRLQTVLLTADGVLHLARRGHFLHISDQDILDKSKANLLAKALVLLQIVWTMFQCLSRKATSLPVSVLEVHTLVHAVCALIMYSLWFNKPLEVEEPTLVSTVEVESEIALMLVRSKYFGVQPIGSLVLPREFRSAAYAKAKYRCWPGDQASEASFLVCDPSWNENNDSTSHEDDPLVVHMGTSFTNHQSVQTVGFEASEGDAGRKCPTTSEDRRNAVNYDSFQLHPRHLAPSPGNTWEEPAVRDIIMSYRQGSRLGQLLSPTASARRRAKRQYNSSRLTNLTLAGSDLLQSDDVWLGFRATPPLGVPTKLSAFTGDLAPGGIGPNAYPVGHWVAPPRIKQPARVVEIPETLRKFLPLDNVDPSSAEYYCPLNISLSEKDLRRWRLASIALHADPAFTTGHGHHSNRLIDLSGPEGSSSGVYFVSELNNHGVGLEEWTAVRMADPHKRHSLFFQGVSRRLVEAHFIRWNGRNACIAMTALLYASIHMALWNYEFPTPTEKLLWRVSAGTLLAIPTLYSILASVFAIHHQVASLVATLQRHRASQRQHNDGTESGAVIEDAKASDLEASNPNDIMNRECEPSNKHGRHHKLIKTTFVEVGVRFVILVAVLYFFSRVFIIIESFLSLRHVPVGVYAGVGWSKYIPHL